MGVLTAAGELVLRRRYFWGKKAGGLYPSDQKAGIDGPCGAVTAGARELCCVMGLSCDFRTSAANLKRVGGLCVCRERLRQIVEAEAATATAMRDGGLLSASWSARHDALEKGRLYAGVDGLLVRTITQGEKDKRRRRTQAARRQRSKAAKTENKAKARGAEPRPLPAPRPGTDQAFKEVKFGVFYDQPKDRRHAVVSAGDAAELGRLLRCHAAQVGIGHARQTVALTDGAPWIARQLSVNLPMLTAHVLDFYHLAQHVHAAANGCLGEGTPAARQWAQVRLSEVKRGGAPPVLEAIDALVKVVRRSPDKREELRRLRGYVAERTAMIDYPQFKRRGWDVGSGPTEAAGKDMAARVRGVGMKWDLDHAADLMNLKALYESGQAEPYWAARSGGAGLN